MRIGFDIAQTCVEKAGCGYYAHALIQAMVPLAPEHQFLLYHSFGRWLNTDTSNGTDLDSPNVKFPFKSISRDEAARIWQTPDELQRAAGTPDIVHANSSQAPKVPGAAIVYTVYDTSFWAVPHYTTENNRLHCQSGLIEALENADGFVFISESAHEEFERFLPGWLEENRKPWIVTHLAPRVSQKLELATSQRYGWLAVGSLEPRKNYERLLTAVELYWKRSSHPQPLKIAGGKGWLSGSLLKRIASLEAKGMVSYLGYVTEEELDELYAKATALVFPSWYEGFGLPVVEAMAHGCPVICSDIACLREVGGDAAIYVDPARPASIVAAMLKLEKSTDLLEESGRTCLQRAAEFNWHDTARKTLDFYHQILTPVRPTAGTDAASNDGS